MDKNKLVKFTEKYYLTGINEAAILKVEKKKLTTLFQTEAKDLRGLVEMDDVELEDCEMGFYSTGEFLKILSILDSQIDVQFRRKSDADESVVNVTMNDQKGRKTTYATCDLEIIESDGKKGAVKSYDIEVELTPSIISDILKSNAAIPSKGITFLSKKNKLFIVFNYSENNSNKIEIELPTEKFDEDFEIMSFPAQYIKSILEVNSKKYDEAYLKISMKGMLTLVFTDLESTAEYWIVKLQD